MPTELLDFVVKSIVDHPEDVRITRSQDGDETILELRVHADDMGKVIGKRGRTAKALRTMIKAAGTRDEQNVSVEILE